MPKLSAYGLASWMIATPLLILQVALLAAVMSGVKDNQGFMYAAFPAMATIVFGVPIGVLLAQRGLRSQGVEHFSSNLGLRLSLAVAAMVGLLFLAMRAGR